MKRIAFLGIFAAATVFAQQPLVIALHTYHSYGAVNRK